MNAIKNWFSEFVNLFFPSISAYKAHDKSLIEYIESTTILEINSRRIIILAPFLVLIPFMGLRGLVEVRPVAFIIMLIVVLIISFYTLYVSYRIYQLKKSSEQTIQAKQTYYERLCESFWIIWAIGMLIIGFGRLNVLMNGTFLMITQLCLAFMPLIRNKKMKILGIGTLIWALILSANLIYFGMNDYLLPALFFIFNSMAMVFIISYVIQRLNLSINVMMAYTKLVGFIDQLTGTYNRRGFQFRVNELVAKETPATVIMFDIDYFKQYNDSFGHLKGDEILKTIADSVKSNLNYEKDILVRLGGEEFAIVNIGSDLVSAQKLAETIKNELDALNIPCPTNEVCNHLTVSIGISEVLVTKNSSIEDLISEADTALYTAKENGRNQIVIS